MDNIFALLPNDIIMNIIRQADGGLHKHKLKMNILFLQIRGRHPIYYYKDDNDDECPQYIYEEHSGRVGTIADSLDDLDSDSDSDDDY